MSHSPHPHTQGNPYHLPPTSANDPSRLLYSHSPQPGPPPGYPATTTVGYTTNNMTRPSPVDSEQDYNQHWSTQAAAGVPPASAAARANGKGKATASTSRVKQDIDEDDFAGSDNDTADGAGGGAGTGGEGGDAGDGGEVKKKSTRGSRACQVCRKLKMRCVGADDPPCKRCRTAGHEVSSPPLRPAHAPRLAVVWHRA